jgi:protein ImuB
LVHPEAPPVELVDGTGRLVGVSGRGSISSTPETLVAGGATHRVVAWAGPWPADERWWDPGARRRRARVQVVTGEGTAHLLSLEGGRWTLEATYD